MAKLQIEVVCVEARASDSGQRAKLIIPAPPPLPVADGYGNPVAHPPPPQALLHLFVTSPERQAILRQIDPLERKKKPLRPELAVDANHKAEIEADRAKIDKEIAALKRLFGDCKEMQLEHGVTYVLTLEKKAATGKAGGK